jgi:hypothetical protein
VSREDLSPSLSAILSCRDGFATVSLFISLFISLSISLSISLDCFVARSRHRERGDERSGYQGPAPRPPARASAAGRLKSRMAGSCAYARLMTSQESPKTRA